MSQSIKTVPRRRFRLPGLRQRSDGMTETSGTSVSRRRAVQTLGISGAVVAFNAATGLWATAAEAATANALDKLPRFDGTLHIDAATRKQYAQDYGRIVHEYPLAVLKPASAADVRRMLVFARRHGIRIVGRGQGHTVFGQSQLLAGVVIDISHLRTIHSITTDEIDVDTGIRWNALLKATLKQGLMPPALTDYIGQTVGGTLSVGGIGGTAHRHGAQIDHVRELQVVTGDGRLVVCSEQQEPDLFNAALAGQGQVAVIVRAKMALVRAPLRIRVFDLIYPDLQTMTAEVTRLIDEGRFDFLEGFSLPQANGIWIHLLQAGTYYTPPSEPDDTTLLAGLHDVRAVMQIEDLFFWDFANRVQVDDSDVQLHPWIDLMLPYPAIDGFVAHVEQTLKPVLPGDVFSILLIPMKPSLFTRPLFRAPASDHAFGFGILRYMPPGDEQAVSEALAYNRQLFDRCLALGGTHYPISAVRLEREDWERHYGAEFSRLATAKARYDTDNVIGSGPDIF
jgi:cytokinin dehydrogenase